MKMINRSVGNIMHLVVETKELEKRPKRFSVNRNSYFLLTLSTVKVFMISRVSKVSGIISRRFGALQSSLEHVSSSKTSVSESPELLLTKPNFAKMNQLYQNRSVNFAVRYPKLLNFKFKKYNVQISKIPWAELPRKSWFSHFLLTNWSRWETKSWFQKFWSDIRDSPRSQLSQDTRVFR